MEFEKRKIKLFILSGKARSGKDSVYGMIKNYYKDKEPKGEYVLIVSGRKEDVSELNNLSVLEHFEYYVNLGISSNDAIKNVAHDMGVAKNIIYKQIVELKKK